jgi:hypothetical protein
MSGTFGSRSVTMGSRSLTGARQQPVRLTFVENDGEPQVCPRNSKRYRHSEERLSGLIDALRGQMSVPYRADIGAVRIEEFRPDAGVLPLRIGSGQVR